MELNEIRKIVEKEGIIFLTYGGFLSQELISSMTEALEREAVEYELGMTVSSNIFTIFIELSQNMMNYSKSKDGNVAYSQGLIMVGQTKDKSQYYVFSQNIISAEDKDKIAEKLVEIKGLTIDELKKRYRELRKSGKNTHEKGGGIGFYEIAKRCDMFDYSFEAIENGRFLFQLKAYINKKG